tara:strand:- start:5023 stop:6750 length:1728 start_codon:yes stop_codon:yes gene_type:complete
MKNYLSKIPTVLEKEEINKSIIIFILTLICSVTELIGIGLIIPIIQIFIGSQAQFHLTFIPEYLRTSAENLLIFTLLCFLLINIIKFFLNKMLIKKQNSFCHNLNAKITKKLFKLYLNQDYSFFVNKSSSELIRNLVHECVLFSIGLVFQVLRLISESVIFISISVFLLIYNFQIALFSLVLFSILGFFLIKRNDKNLKFWGKMRQFHSAQALRQLQQSFGSYRELIINNLINIFFKQYSYHVEENAKFGINKDTVIQMPRLILELVAVFVLISIITFLIIQGNSLSEILVLLGVIFYSTLRLLPSISKIVVAAQNIKYNKAVFDVIYTGLTNYNNFAFESNNKPNQNDGFKDFNKIILNEVGFSYSKEKKIFQNLNLIINKGDKIGIVGKTGSGKSTLTNILCGLIDIEDGQIYTDDNKNKKNYKSIQKLIGYVPQSVSIFDESIIFNISLKDKVSDQELEKINKILEIVDLTNVVENLTQKHYEKIGENGSKLSGGQNQRLGIARALFKDPTILILDEATNALDIITEEKIINNVLNYFSTLTIISISHRPASLKFCDKIIEIKNFNIVTKGS